MLQYIGKRMLLAIPTLIIISIVSYFVIELPPGDYLTTYVMRLIEQGDYLDQAEIDALYDRYGLNDPVYVRYAKWIGNILLHGDFGQSFDWQMPVKRLIWTRLSMTLILSLGTLAVTWMLAIPIGVLSATRQYSLLDHAATFLGFLGLGVPNFLLALILMWVAFAYFGQSVGGLFSQEFADAPWSWARVVDLMKHLWIPVLVLGTSGTASLIRTMRANLLDELNKPYVETGRAKGLPERRLLWKYPVRLALNPFVSSVAWAIPRLVSGSTITAVVLSLPTMGPLLLRSLQAQDMYLAGSILLLVSALTVLGTMISDIILAAVDPRIRFD